MRRLKILTFIVVILFSLTSCHLFKAMAVPDAAFYDRSMYAPMRDARAFYDTLGRELIVFPMRTMATPKHLAYFKTYLDAKKEQGYVVYYETIDISTDNEMLTAEQIDTLRRKYRRVVGEDLDRMPKSLNKHIKTEYIRKSYNLYSWIDSLGLTTSADHHVDMSLSQIIASYEHRYKAIPLHDIDFQTALDAQTYSPVDTVTHDKFYMLWEPRAQYLVNHIVSSSNMKVIVVCSEDLMGYMLRPLFETGYHSDYGFGASEDYKQIINLE